MGAFSVTGRFSSVGWPYTVHDDEKMMPFTLYLGISRAQLHRRMKEITGLSSGKFLRNLRMEQAARLLREGSVNVAQIASLVGYVDQAHFSTAFKAHFGQSPSEYADTHKTNN